MNKKELETKKKILKLANNIAHFLMLTVVLITCSKAFWGFYIVFKDINSAVYLSVGTGMMMLLYILGFTSLFDEKIDRGDI